MRYNTCQILDKEYKIHFPGCGCNSYKKLMKNKEDKFLVTLVRNNSKEKNPQRFYIYDNEEKLLRNMKYLTKNCLCTHDLKHLNGCCIIISNYPNIIESRNTEELEDVKFIKISEIQYLKDISGLMYDFYKFYGEKLRDKYVILGKNKEDKTFSFPKGKIKYGETEEQCVLREFMEETDIIISDYLLEKDYQISLRNKNNCMDIPVTLYIRNFNVKILFIN